MTRILTVSLNAAVDLSYVVESFGVGRINKVREVTRQAGGKANNAARVLASLGQPVLATGFAGGAAGRFILENLAGHGIATDYEPIAAENRTCTAVVDPVGKTLTEIREPGPTLSKADGDRFLSRFRRLLGGVDLAIISGSLPPGLPVDFYARLVGEAWRTNQVRCLVDAAGPVLEATLPAQPYLVKPNLEELEEWAGSKLPHDRAVLAAARELMESGPLVVAVSLGSQGLIVASPEGAWKAIPPRVEALNTVGSGDSLVAGLAAGLAQGLSAEEILRLAVGCGTANALTPAVAVVRPDDLARIRPQVTIQRLA